MHMRSAEVAAKSVSLGAYSHTSQSTQLPSEIFPHLSTPRH
jgi:hypothetical protein